MAKEAEAHAEEDKAKKEAVEARNMLDSAVYQAEKMKSDNSDKLSDEDKKTLDEAVEAAKKVMADEKADKDALEEAAKELNDKIMPIGAKMYEAGLSRRSRRPKTPTMPTMARSDKKQKGRSHRRRSRRRQRRRQRQERVKMTDSGDTPPRNPAEIVAREDSEKIDNWYATHPEVWLCLYQDGGFWLHEAYNWQPGDEDKLDEPWGTDDEYKVQFPSFEWNRELYPFEVAVKDYLSDLSPDFREATIESKKLKDKIPQLEKVIAFVNVQQGPSKNTAIKVKESVPIRWFKTEDAKDIGFASMSREYEWQNDLFKRIKEHFKQS